MDDLNTMMLESIQDLIDTEEQIGAWKYYDELTDKEKEIIDTLMKKKLYQEEREYLNEMFKIEQSVPLGHVIRFMEEEMLYC